MNWYKLSQQILNVNPYLSKEEKSSIREINKNIKEQQFALEMYQNSILEKQNKAKQENRPLNEDEQTYIKGAEFYIDKISTGIQRLQGNVEFIKNKVKEELSQEVSGGRKTTSLINQAVKEFKTTTDINEAGYILPNGRMLDFSGKREGQSGGGGRPIDHRAIARIKGIEGSYTDGMNEFINNTGAIRVNSSKGLGINIYRPITSQQKTTILRNIRGKEYFLIDISDVGGISIWQKEIEMPRVYDASKLIEEASQQF